VKSRLTALSPGRTLGPAPGWVGGIRLASSVTLWRLLAAGNDQSVTLDLTWTVDGR